MIRVVEIRQVRLHPDSQSLKVCRVWDGQKEVVVVCGADNAKEGIYTLLAEKGDELPSGKIINEVSLRGVKSFGMLCSAKDLEISLESGIVNLPKDFELGTAWEKLEKSLLSATPWYLYKEVDSYYWDRRRRKVVVVLEGGHPPKGLELMARSYFYEGEYRYRDFSRGLL